jgi:hypothetical protein
VVTYCAMFGALFVILSALSVAILVAVNWRPWRIYRYLLPRLQLVWELVLGSRNSVYEDICVEEYVCLCVAVSRKLLVNSRNEC